MTEPNFLPKKFTYEKELKYDIDNFDWDFVYAPLPSPCQMYLHSFNHIKYLIQGYELTLNEKYIDLAGHLIRSWLNYEQQSENNFIWLKDTGPDRSIVMLYFILISKKNNIVKNIPLINEMKSSLKKHANFFYNDNYYKPHNHGTMIDRALYLVAIYLNDSSSAKYRKKSVDRLVSALKRNFSDQMVNLESAIAYHLLNLELFVSIETILSRFGDMCGMDQKSIENAIDFLIYASKPDLYLPIIGDSQRLKITDITNYSFYRHVKHYHPLMWLLTSKKSGQKPKDLLKVYENEGFAFLRNKWDMHENNVVYASFISGSGNPNHITHKHADDLSFTLFAKGKDIFVDSGIYTYESGDMRNYFISALAHNTLVVDDNTYPIHLWAGSGDFSKTLNLNNSKQWGDVNDTGILDYGTEDDYYYVVGKNDMYDGVNITRSLYMLKNGYIVIVDDIQSYDIHNYSQYYHLSPNITIKGIKVKQEDKNTKVVIFDDELKLNLIQIGQCDFNLIKGDKKNNGPGIVSETYANAIETNSLKFSLKSKNSRFITLITVDEVNEKDDIKFYIEHNYSYKSEEELIIEKSGKQTRLPLLNYSRPIFKEHRNLVLEQKDSNLYTFTIPDANSNESFAWYIMKNGEKVDMIWYSPNPVLNYLFTESGDYQIKFFINNGENKKMYTFHKIIAVTEEDISKSKINVGP